MREEVNGFPELSEVDVVRHFTRLSTWNYGVDSGFYPLGSCTMKYNPKVNEAAARLPGLAGVHPCTPEPLSQGALELMFRLQEALAEISGFPAVTLQPAAGAHGELAGMLMIRAWHEAQGNARSKVLIPDTAHGTNPASAALCGYEVVPVASDGVLSAAAVAELMDDEVAALMVTNPNTLGLFETQIREICDVVHAKGAWSTATAPTSTPCWASPGPATWGSTSCTSTCTRPSPPPMAAADPAPGPSG